VLSRYSTNMYAHYGSPMRENRKTNVEICLPRFRGVVLGPGDEFSFNGVIGERREADGFKRSIVFKRGTDGTVDEEWESGGGICQLATTLFNAALLADLKITERNHHSKMIGYAPPARDATVYWGGADLKFVNSLSRPIMLWGEMQGWDLVITVVGDLRDKFDVDLQTAMHDGPKGQSGTLWRTVRRPGGEIVRNHEWICDSFYHHDEPD
jgi:vancomycin resistance protein YoaR